MTDRSKLDLSRRRLLKQLGLGAGATLLLPFVDRLLSLEAHAATPSKKRLVVFSFGNGLHEKRWTQTPRSETDFDLPACLQPLAPYKSDLLFLSKFYNPHGHYLHGNVEATTLSVMPPELPLERPGGISIDRLIARSIGANDAFSSTCVAAWYGTYHNRASTVSADGPGTPYPGEWNPVRFFELLFGTGASATDGQLLARNKSLLDFVAKDAAKLQARLPAAEQPKLEQYVASLQGLDAQFQAIARVRAQVTRPAAPTADGTNESGTVDADFKHNDLVRATWEALVDVSFQALANGFTRVATVNLMPLAHHSTLAWIDKDKNHHDSCHVSDDAAILAFDQYYMSMVARMMAKLKATPDGAGSMADGTLVMVVNHGGGEHHEGFDNIPIVLLGSAGGYFRTGRWLQYSSKSHCVSDVYVSVANAMGVDIKTFGDPKVCLGPLPGLT